MPQTQTIQFPGHGQTPYAGLEGEVKPMDQVPIDGSESSSSIKKYLNAGSEGWNAFAKVNNENIETQKVKQILASRDEGMKAFIGEAAKKYEPVRSAGGPNVMDYIPPKWVSTDTFGNTDYMDWYKRATIGLNAYESVLGGMSKAKTEAENKQYERNKDAFGQQKDIASFGQTVRMNDETIKDNEWKRMHPKAAGGGFDEKDAWGQLNNFIAQRDRASNAILDAQAKVVAQQNKVDGIGGNRLTDQTLIDLQATLDRERKIYEAAENRRIDYAKSQETDAQKQEWKSILENDVPNISSSIVQSIKAPAATETITGNEASSAADPMESWGKAHTMIRQLPKAIQPYVTKTVYKSIYGVDLPDQSPEYSYSGTGYADTPSNNNIDDNAVNDYISANIDYFKTNYPKEIGSDKKGSKALTDAVRSLLEKNKQTQK